MTERLKGPAGPAFNPLFPAHDRREVLDRYVGASLNRAMGKNGTRGVTPSAEYGRFRSDLQAMDFADSQAPEAVVDWMIGALDTGMVHTTSPGYLGLFNPKPTFPAEIGDRIAAAFNPQACVWSHAPIAVDIEKHLIEAVAKQAGLPLGSGGHFTSGGSEANATAFLCALMAAERGFAEDGTAAFSGRPRIYISDESHLAWLKIAKQSGVGQLSVCRIQTDGSGRMDADRLRDAIENDLRSGKRPIMIAATAGTTNAGMIDPLHACRGLADEFGLWFHVDAAWGGALICSTQHRHELAGIDSADSITIDAHKWFASTMGTGMFLIREPSLLPQVFGVSTSYMPSNDEAIDPYVNSFQWSRRFLGIRLFMSLAIGGWAAYEDHIEHSIRLANRFANELTQYGWVHANSSPMAIACLRPPPGAPDVEEIVAKVIELGTHWISVANYEGQPVIRICVTNYETDWAHLAALVTLLRSIVE
ncbi:MAG: pyridoxal-dependent decarboxylase [Pseudomonadota bacterium]